MGVLNNNMMTFGMTAIDCKLNNWESSQFEKDFWKCIMPAGIVVLGYSSCCWTYL